MSTTIRRTTRWNPGRTLAGGSAVLLAGVLQCAVAQTTPQTATPGPSATAPGRAADTPRPDELEPGVRTSDSAAPAATQGNTQPSANGQSANQNSGSNAARVKANSKAKAADAPAPRKTAGAASGAAGTGAAASGPAGTGAAGAGAPGAKTGAGKAQDRLELDETQITGNRELPKVLYIVPWKRSDLGDLVGKPVNSLIDEVLSPVDRDVFKRENRYYDALKPDESKQGAGAATTGVGSAGSAAGKAPATGSAPGTGSAPTAPSGGKP